MNCIDRFLSLFFILLSFFSGWGRSVLELMRLSCMDGEPMHVTCIYTSVRGFFSGGGVLVGRRELQCVARGG